MIPSAFVKIIEMPMYIVIISTKAFKPVVLKEIEVQCTSNVLCDASKTSASHNQ